MAVGTLPDIEDALRTGEVSVDVLVQVYFGRTDADAEVSAAYDQYYDRVVAAFENRYGRIRNRFLAPKCQTGLVITDRDEIRGTYLLEGAPIPPECLEIMDEATVVGDDVVRLLAGADRRYVADECYTAANRALAIAEGYHASEEAAERKKALSELPMARRALENARRALEGATQRRAQTEYLLGTVVGIPILVLVGVLVALALAELDAGDDSLRTIFACVTTGSLGAIVSVLSRMTTGGLELDDRAGASTLRRMGVIRPFVGAIFAVAVYLLVAGEVVPIETPADEETRRLFYAAFGFVAGFSERFAQDMLVGVQKA